VWQHFLRDKQCQEAQCNLCNAKLKTVGGSTTGLHEHLHSMHQISVLKRSASHSDDNSPQPTTSKRLTTQSGSMCQFMISRNENTLAATLARMTAKDGLPFRVFVMSSDLRRALTELGVGSLPNSTTDVKQTVMAEGQKIRTAVKGELVSKQKKGQRFSITFNEWNRRYMNVNVHVDGPTFWSLGLF